MATSKTRFLLWFIALVTIMACVPGGAVPVIPTIDPNAVGTLIRQTANAALTQTARAMPTVTPTATITPTRATNTPEPTATSTVIFIFSSPTLRVPSTSTIAPSSNKAYACQVLSVTPANGTSLAGRTNFDATWRVRNNGQRNWNRDIVNYLFLDGTRLHTVEAYGLQDTVKIGETVGLTVDMVAPKNSGTYTTNWTLHVDIRNFCTMSLTIVVK